MVEPVLLTAMGVEALLGWPRWVHRRLGHPVGLFAGMIDACEAALNRRSRGRLHRRLAGVAACIALLSLAAGGAWLAEEWVRALAGVWAWPVLALLAWPALAMRSLDDHVRPILSALERGDLDGARTSVAMIVGRDTAQLDEAGVARAAIESVAESFCDGVVAPVFWLLLLGLPGAWGYKAANTADSIIGHPEEPLRDYGWAAARLDDLLNLLPARLSAYLICMAGGGGWRILARDHDRHASPNAGWPEAAMAGALQVRLAGPVSYDGIARDKPWIGDGVAADAGSLRRALRIYRRACVLLALIVAGATWLL